MKQKIIFFDIDGTIYHYKHGMPKDTYESICLLKEKGHIPVICTGRTKCMIYPGHMSPGFEYIIAGAGTHIVAQNREIYLSEMKKEQVDELQEICRASGMIEIGEGKDYLYLGKGSEQLEGELKVIRDSYIKEIGDKIKVFDSGKKRLSKMSAFLVPGCDMERVMNQTKNAYHLVNHKGLLMEFIPKGEGKAQGIDRMIRELGMCQEDTISFGDSYNDYDMLEYTNISVAMGNGDEEIKQMADYVTAPFDQGGVTMALKKLNLI